MANKNTKRRQRHLAVEKRGNWGTPGTKKKKQPFPSKDGMTLEKQRALFYGR